MELYKCNSPDKCYECGKLVDRLVKLEQVDKDVDYYDIQCVYICADCLVRAVKLVNEGVLS